MAYQIDTAQYQLNLYLNAESGPNSPWKNENLYLVAADTNGNIPVNLEMRATNPVVGESYFLIARVNNKSSKSTIIREMRFEFPTWVSVDGEKIKSIGISAAHHSVRGTVRNTPGLGLIVSDSSVVFTHPGDYEMSAQIKSWDQDSNFLQDPLPDEYPTSGPLYGRNGIKVSQS